jgi:hypothetical protein
MARRFSLAAVVAAAVVALPASAFAATAPTAPPTLTTTPYAPPATFTWTPAVNGPDPLDPNTSQQVYRADGVCPAGAVSAGGPVGPVRATTAGSHTTSEDIPDGIYCFHIRTASLLGDTADGPGLTVLIDTENPTGTLALTPSAPGNFLSGTVAVSGTSADAVSGVASSTFHFGPANGCASGAVIGPSWDTTAVANGTYRVCNVVVDNAGHQAIAATAVTIANPIAPPVAPAPVPAAVESATPPPVTPPVIANPAADPAAPKAPTKVTYSVPRAKARTGKVAVTLRWVNPAASDLGSVVVVLNLKRPPRSGTDGTKLYTGLGTSTVLRLKAGGTGHVALFAHDRSGNISTPARKLVSLATLIPLRPATGSSVQRAPRLTWKPQKGSAYYNVQLFVNGARVLVGWPSKAWFSVPPGKLRPGTYVWFVWPAVRHGGKPPTFGKLIGRATFVYRP